MPIPFKEPGNTPTLNIGEGAFLRMRNNMPKSTKVVLNVTVLNLRPGWASPASSPRDTPFMPIDPGTEELMHFRAGLPEGYTEVDYTLKVFATVDPTNYDWLELPKLDESPKGDNTRGLPSNPLEQLMAAFDRRASHARCCSDGISQPPVDDGDYRGRRL